MRLKNYRIVWLWLVCSVCLLDVQSSKAEEEEVLLNKGLVAYWPLDGDFKDVIGGHDGIKRGGGISFEHAKEAKGFVRRMKMVGLGYLQVGGNENAFDFKNRSMSISLWFKAEEGTRARTLIAKGGSRVWRLHLLKSNRLRFQAYRENLMSEQQSHAWHHVVVVSDQAANEKRLYVDGALIDSDSHPETENNNLPVMIGTTPDTVNDQRYDGYLDDIGVWSRALGEQEIAALWNSGSGTPIAYLLEDEDNDGLPEYWETRFGLSTLVADDAEDADGDGLTTLEEFEMGTDPTMRDTDRDGLSDKVETNTGAWISETNSGTDPLVSDSDGDGLPDGGENPNVSTDIRPPSNPNMVDSDGDTYPDRHETHLGQFEAVGPPEVNLNVDGKLAVSVPSRSDAYYVLYELDETLKMESPIAAAMGTSDRLTFHSSRLAKGSKYFRVKRYVEPGDLDEDGIDDVTELTSGGSMAPLNPGKPLHPDSGALMLETHEQFVRLSVDARLGNVRSAIGEQMINIIIGLPFDESDSPEVYFINTSIHRGHDEFLSHEEIDCNNKFRRCIHGELYFVSNTILGEGLYLLNVRNYVGDDLYSAFSAVEKNAPASQGELGLLLNERIPERQREELSKMDIRAFDESELRISELIYSGLNEGAAFGRLRIIEPGQRPSAQDIAIFTTIPNDVPRIAGIITEKRQTPLSHVNLRAIQNGSPNAFIRGATTHERIEPLIGEFVFYRVAFTGFELRKATKEEVDAFLSELRPSETQVLDRNLAITAALSLDEIGFEDSSAFGVKAANVAEMRKISGWFREVVPEGYALPFYFYDEFMKRNGLYQRAEAILNQPSFKNSLSARDALLKELRDEIQSASMPDLLALELGRIRNSFPEGASIRCRSSTNNEDLPDFNGAGLYDSFTHHPDEGGLSESVRQVFASLWNLRAFEEREFYRIDHFSAAMGVLLHQNYENEDSNGVAVSKNLLSFDPVRDRSVRY